MKCLIRVLSLCLFITLVYGKPKIDRKLLNLGLTDTSNILISLAEGTESVLEAFNQETFETRDERLNALHERLNAHAAASQARVLGLLSGLSGIEVTPYWISNQISVKRATVGIISVLNSLPEIAAIEEEFLVPFVGVAPAAVIPGTAPLYGVYKLKADEVWALGYMGQGIRVGNIDTGVLGSHEALTGRLLDTYGWYDPLDPLSLTPPNDEDGHGTHTMGTMTGTHGIGVAPNATWMACKGCSPAGCPNNLLIACGQYFLCPEIGVLFPSKDCTKAPHIINNSWGGDGGNNFYSSVVAAWRSAGIIPVFANGNAGPNCNTTGSPGDYPNVIGVGATNSSDGLTDFSSLGPASGGRIKPDIAAPGAAITSSYHLGDTSYATLDGTSMAAPHVSGTIALLLSKNPNLNYDAIYKAITDNADRDTLNGATRNCGGKPDSAFPNNAFGYGRINAYRAIQAV